MNVKELIEYLQGFPDDADVHINVIDTHMDKKYGFVVERFAAITDEKTRSFSWILTTWNR